MKKILILLIAVAFSGIVSAQNIQTHYDMGDGRGYLTTTVEMFRPDKLGSTFFFVDMNYGAGDVKGVSEAYWEIARAFKLSKTSPLAAHIEYNGGFGQWAEGEFNGHYQIADCWLGGLEYSWNAEDFSRGFTLQAMYKNIRGIDDASFQITGVWYLNFLKGKMSFTGFADFWKEESAYGDFIFLTEPQIWYNVCSHFAVGSEIEISSNFAGNDGFMVNPTLALKYAF